jgi:hypothetical protein
MNLKTDPKNDLWAFREGRKRVSGDALFADMANAADVYCARPADNRLAISALMRAGEFEGGIADADSHAQASAQQLTDCLSSAFLGEASDNDLIASLLDKIGRFEMPEHLSVAPPEGFAYYALHPHDFARLADQVAGSGDSFLVIGIRSIGTTLSAVVRAALKRQGKRTERITVRPTGHPYDRVVRFTWTQLQCIAEWNTRTANFLVVDEGPGRSGSSFLSVAEALVKAGVARNKITLLGSRPVDVNQLCAENARQRWTQFTFIWPEPSVYTRFSDHLYLGGGAWRDILFEGRVDWPTCWPQMERLKFLSPDRRSIFKFEGFGHFGAEVLTRAQILAKCGFGCRADDAGDGMVRYPLIQSLPAEASDLSSEILTRLARYCAFRTAEFRSPSAPPTQLPAMLRFNTFQEFGVELGSEVDELCTLEPILADGRMQSHEWIRAADANLLKVDAYTHGDDHFFPGPTDIAWDLAGAIVEWNINNNTADFLLSEFRRISGMDRARIIASFVLAYTVFRLAYCKMALSTVKGSPEEPRVSDAYLHYRSLAEQQLRGMKALRNSALKPVAPAPDLSVQSGTAA